MGSKFNLYAISSIADSKAKAPVASPGPRIHIGLPLFSGTIRYFVTTLGQAYINLVMLTVPSVKSS